MATGTHTPGPWEAKDAGYRGWNPEPRAWLGVIVAANGEEVYSGPGTFKSLRGKNAKEAEANARLMAASPCLLKELTRLVRLIDEGNIGPRSKRKTAAARAAIARATAPGGAEVKP